MSHWNREPEWLPVNTDGTHWQFVSYKGRHLGRVVKVSTEQGAAYLSDKFCCKDSRVHLYMESASARVESTLYCKDCKLSCLPASN